MPRKKLLPADPALAVAYIRASKEEQKLSPEAQREAINTWAKRTGVKVVSWHHDIDVSGGDDSDEVLGEQLIRSRPELILALDALRPANAGLLVVAKRDRLARSAFLAAAIERMASKRGAHVVSAAGEGSGGDTPADQFMRTIIDGAAEYERGLIRERTKRALAVKSARGERVGSVKYGFELSADGIHLRKLPSEQKVIAIVESMSKKGVSISKIIAALEEKEIKSRTGRKFLPEQIYRMLRNATTKK